MKAEANIQDKTLVLQLRNNSINAFDLLFYKYSNKLYAFAFSILKDSEHSKEIVQEAFCRIWEKRHELEPSKSFKSFLFKISYNLIIDQMRLNVKNKEYLNYLRYFTDNKEIPNHNLTDYYSIADKVKSAVEEFPNKRKQVYKLSREEGLSQKQIANKLGISVKTVENQINLSLKHLRMRLGKDILPVLIFWLTV